MLDEVEKVLHYPRLLKRFGFADSDITQFIAFLAASAEIVETDDSFATPIRDPKDVHILQTAIAGNAEYLCTRDSHFTEPTVTRFCADRGIAVISDLDLLRLIRTAPSRSLGPSLNGFN